MNTTTSKLQKHQLSLPFLLRLLFLLTIFSFLSISFPNMGIAAKVYRTGIDPTPQPQPFEVYDTITESWTVLGTVDTGAQLAVSADQKLYMYNRATNMIQVYDPDGNTWTDVLAGPDIDAGYGNLEVTNDGEFILTYSLFNGADAKQMHYTVGGTWNIFVLPDNASAFADYDHATGTFVVGKVANEEVWKIDLSTFEVITFLNGASSTGEIRRFGEIYNGHWYSQTFTNPITHYDLSNNSLQIIKETATFPDPPDPNIARFYSATVDHANGIFYLNTYGTSGDTIFATWDPLTDTYNNWDPLTETFTFKLLSPAPSATSGGHSTIAFVNQSSNQPPVANAGPDQTEVECTSSSGASVALDGSGSSDPDGDPIVSYTWTGPFGTATDVNPTVTMQLGISNATLIVNDGSVDSEPDTVMITVVDTTAPDVRAKLRKKRGCYFRVEFSATDICDTDPTIDALLNKVSVTNGQLVKLKHKKKFKVNISDDDGSSDDDDSNDNDKVVTFKGSIFNLEVTATDDSGNVGMGSDTFPSRHGDDDSNDDRELKKKLKNALKKKWRKRYSKDNSNGHREWWNWRKWRNWGI